jgi:hypothetical protein
MALSNWRRLLVLIALLALVPGRCIAQPWATSGNNIYNTNSGYVGIGTSNPAAPLEVDSLGNTFSIYPNGYGAAVIATTGPGGTTPPVYFFEPINAPRLNALRFADQFLGSDAGAKITAAIADLPTTGGIVDARGLSGPQTFSTGINVGASGVGKPVTLLLGPGVYTTNGLVTVYQNSSIIGVPVGLSDGVSPAIDVRNAQRTVIEAATGAALWAVVRIGDDTDAGAAYGALLQDVTIDGNCGITFNIITSTITPSNGSCPNGGTRTDPNGATLLVTNSPAVNLTRVSVQNSAGHGILIRSPDGLANTSEGTKLLHVSSDFNRLDGLYVYKTTDIIVSQSWFEHSIGHGIELESTGAFRINNSDISSNFSWPGNFGVYIHGTVNAGYHVVTGNQFSNVNDDVHIEGTVAENNIISSNMFLGNGPRGSVSTTVSPIHINDSPGNNIMGNTIRALGQRLDSAIKVEGSNGKNNVVTSNVISKGGGSFVNVAVTVPGGNTTANNVAY